MKRFKQLLGNFRYISKHNLRKGKMLDFTYEQLLENILYYVPDSSIIRPSILNLSQTVDALCDSNKSIIRFGDGEIGIISGSDIPFQQYDHILAKRMAEIIKNQDDNILIGINYSYFHPQFNPLKNEIDKKFQLYSMPIFRRDLVRLIDFNKTYCDAAFTGLFGQKSKSSDEIYQKIRNIWKNKKVLLVGCAQAHQKYKFNLFDNASEEIWLHIPNKNAFSEYDNILRQIKQYPTDVIIVLMAGPTAKLLAYDLTALGYRALDLGHIAKSYDWYCRQLELTNSAIHDFWAPDV